MDNQSSTMESNSPEMPAAETSQLTRKRGRGGASTEQRKAEQEAKLRAAMEALVGSGWVDTGSAEKGVASGFDFTDVQTAVSHKQRVGLIEVEGRELADGQVLKTWRLEDRAAASARRQDVGGEEEDGEVLEDDNEDEDNRGGNDLDGAAIGGEEDEEEEEEEEEVFNGGGGDSPIGDNPLEDEDDEDEDEDGLFAVLKMSGSSKPATPAAPVVSSKNPTNGGEGLLLSQEKEEVRNEVLLPEQNTVNSAHVEDKHTQVAVASHADHDITDAYDGDAGRTTAGQNSLELPAPPTPPQEIKEDPDEWEDKRHLASKSHREQQPPASLPSFEEQEQPHEAAASRREPEFPRNNSQPSMQQRQQQPSNQRRNSIDETSHYSGKSGGDHDSNKNNGSDLGGQRNRDVDKDQRQFQHRNETPRNQHHLQNNHPHLQQQQQTPRGTAPPSSSGASGGGFALRVGGGGLERGSRPHSQPQAPPRPYQNQVQQQQPWEQRSKQDGGIGGGGCREAPQHNRNTNQRLPQAPSETFDRLRRDHKGGGAEQQHGNCDEGPRWPGGGRGGMDQRQPSPPTLENQHVRSRSRSRSRSPVFRPQNGVSRQDRHRQQQQQQQQQEQQQQGSRNVAKPAHDRCRPPSNSGDGSGGGRTPHHGGGGGESQEHRHARDVTRSPSPLFRPGAASAAAVSATPSFAREEEVVDAFGRSRLPSPPRRQSPSPSPEYRPLHAASSSSSSFASSPAPAVKSAQKAPRSTSSPSPEYVPSFSVAVRTATDASSRPEPSANQARGARGLEGASGEGEGCGTSREGANGDSGACGGRGAGAGASSLEPARQQREREREREQGDCRTDTGAFAQLPSGAVRLCLKGLGFDVTERTVREHCVSAIAAGGGAGGGGGRGGSDGRSSVVLGVEMIPPVAFVVVRSQMDAEVITKALNKVKDESATGKGKGKGGGCKEKHPLVKRGGYLQCQVANERGYASTKLRLARETGGSGILSRLGNDPRRGYEGGEKEARGGGALSEEVTGNKKRPWENKSKGAGASNLPQKDSAHAVEAEDVPAGGHRQIILRGAGDGGLSVVADNSVSKGGGGNKGKGKGGGGEVESEGGKRLKIEQQQQQELQQEEDNASRTGENSMAGFEGISGDVGGDVGGVAGDFRVQTFAELMERKKRQQYRSPS